MVPVPLPGFNRCVKTGGAVKICQCRAVMGRAAADSAGRNCGAGGFGETLKLTERPPANTPVTPETAREVCQRAASKPYIAGTIASPGSEYVLGLKAVNCQNGETLAQEQVTAAAKEKVVDALGGAAARLRAELGESLATVQKFDVPLEQATTSSLGRSLGKLHTGDEQRAHGEDTESIPIYKHTVDLDPNFAMAYAKLGLLCEELQESASSQEWYKKAFELRARTSEQEILHLRLVLTNRSTI
jgi:hypothetical protein